MTTPNYDDILNALDRTALLFEGKYVVGSIDRSENARLLREAMEIVRKHRDVVEDARDRPI